MTWTAKDPTEILDYSWPVPLDAGDTIATRTTSVVSGTITIASDEIQGGNVVAWIVGGADGETAIITMRATTAGGRTFEHTGQIRVIDSANAFEVAFKAAFPSFADTPREAIAYWREQAELIVDARFETSEAHALKLLTAHHLTLQGYGSGSEAQRMAKFGGATRVKSSTLELAWDGQGSASGVSSYSQTIYGKQFLPLMRIYCGGPRVTDSGALPYDPARYPHGAA